MTPSGRRGALSTLRLLLLVSVLLALGRSTAYADEASSPADRASPAPTQDQAETTRALRREGELLFEAGHYAEALPKLRAAQLAEPTAGTLERIAEAERALGHYARAHAAYEELLTTRSASLTAEQRTKAENALVELTESTGLLELSFLDPPEELFVNGLIVELLEGSSWVERVDPGSQTVSARKPGFQPFQTTVDVEAGALVRVEVTFQPEQAPEPKAVEAPLHLGTLTVRANSPEATLEVQGHKHPLPFSGQLPEGSYQVIVRAPGYRSEAREIQIVANREHLEVLWLSREATLPKAITPPSERTEPTERTERAVQAGILLGALTVPRPLQVEVGVRIKSILSLGVQYSMLPEISLPTEYSSSVSLRALQGQARWFPFAGAFFVGVGVGTQRVGVNAENDFAEIRVDARTFIVTPQLGWLWVTDSGVSFGVGVGLQLPFGSVPGVTSRDKSGATLPEDAEIVRRDFENDVRDLVQLGLETPLPVVDLLKLGFYF